MKRRPSTNDNLPASERWMPVEGPAPSNPLPGIERAMKDAEVFIASYDAVTSLARSMFLADNPRGIWEALDEGERGYWMRRAALRNGLGAD